MQELVVYAAKSKKVMYSITFVILPVTKTIFCTRGCFSASLGLKMNIDSLSWPYGHLRLSNLSFPALVTLENNHSYQKLFPTLGKWQMNEVKYYSLLHSHLLHDAFSSTPTKLQGAPYVFERFSEAVLRPWVDVEMKCYHILLTQVYTFQIP